MAHLGNPGLNLVRFTFGSRSFEAGVTFQFGFRLDLILMPSTGRTLSGNYMHTRRHDL